MEISVVIAALSFEVSVSVELDASNFKQEATVNPICARIEAIHNFFDFVERACRKRTILKFEFLIKVPISNDISSSKASRFPLAA